MKTNKFKYLSLFLLFIPFLLPLFSWDSRIGEIFISFYFLIFLSHLIATILFALTNNKIPAFLLAGITLYEGWRVLESYHPTFEKKPPNSQSSLTIFHYNVHYQNREHDRLINWLQSPEDGHYDIVFLVEVIPSLFEKLKQLKAIYPYQHYYIDPETGLKSYLVILSKTDFKAESKPYPLDTGIYGYAHIDIGSGRFLSFYGAHLQAPITSVHFYARNIELQHLAQVIKSDSSSYKILVGDLNTSNYSYHFENLLKVSGLESSHYPIFEKSWPTWAPAFFRTNIDHCLVSKQVTILERKLGPHLGSDHLPVITKIAL